MARKELNAEEIAELRKNQYVEKIQEGRITFSSQFKRMAYQQLMDGKLMRAIFAENGIDPKILGNRRIWCFTERLRANGDRDEGFEDLRKNNIHKPAKESKELTLATRVEQLEHELAYTRQEVEFLKKVQTADMEARSSWESKQRRK